MFEKEAEEWAKETMDCVKTENCLNQDCNYFSDEERIIAKSAFEDGAEFGYNKANEWHYMEDGVMPRENQWVLVYDGSFTVCNYHSNTAIKWLDNYENEVYEGNIIAWKEIEPPKECEND